MRHCVVLLLLFVSAATQAQDAKKGLKYYYKDKLEDAEEQFSTLARTYRFSVLGNFGMALLYFDDRYANKDVFKAYEHIQVAIENKKTIENRKNMLEEVDKYFALDSLDALNTRINTVLYDSVMAADSWKFTQFFLANCKSSPHYADVEKVGVFQEFRAVKDTNTVASFDWYLKRYPTSDNVEEATKLRNELAFANVTQSGTLAAYQLFLDSYPDSEQSPKAQELVYKLAYDQALQAKTVEAYEKFIAEYPDAPQVEATKTALVALEFANAQKTNTDQAWDDFMDKYPDSEQGKIARKLKEKLAYDNANTIQTKQAYEYFMRKYPASEYYNRAFDARTNLASANVSFYQKQGMEPSSIKVFDRFNNNSSAVRLVQTKQGYLILGKTNNSKKWFNDAWVIHVNPTGGLIWETQLGTSADDAFSYAVELPDGYVLAGYKQAKTATDRKLWIVKLDTNGKQLWEKEAEGVAVNGLFKSGDDLLLISSMLDKDKMRQLNLLRLDAKGELKAYKTHSMLGIPQAACQRADGSLWVVTQKFLLQITDQFEIGKQVELGKLNTAFNVKSSTDGLFVIGKHYDYKLAAKSDYWLAKFSDAGDLLWEKMYDHSNNQDIAYDVISKADGTLQLFGLSEANNSDNMVILNLSADGTQQSESVLGTEASDRRPSVIDNNGLTMLLSSGTSPYIMFVRF